MANEVRPFYEPGGAITGHPTTAVIGKRFVAISGDRQSSANGGNVSIAPAGAGARIFGVASHDAAVGDKVTVLRIPGIVVPVVADGAIAANAEVTVGAAGKAKTLGAQTAVFVVGRVLTAAADGADAQVELYAGPRYVPAP